MDALQCMQQFHLIGHFKAPDNILFLEKLDNTCDN